MALPYTNLTEPLLEIIDHAVAGLYACTGGGDRRLPARELALLDELLADIADHDQEISQVDDLRVADIEEPAVWSALDWHRIADAMAERRAQRSAATPATHPIHAFHALERSLDQPWDFAARIACASMPTLRRWARAPMERAGLATPCSVRTFVDLIAWNLDRWSALFNAITEQDLLVERGVISRWSGENRLNDPIDHELRLEPRLAERLSGLRWEDASSLGVLTTPPRHRLDEVILPDHLRTEVAALIQRRPSGQAVGVLISGPSGSGKTMLAHAIAHGLGVSVLEVTVERGRDAEESSWDVAVGYGLAEAARTGHVLFIDEAHDVIDKPGVARRLLTAMDRTPMVLVCATTRPSAFPIGFNRRFPVQIDMPLPTVAARAAILCQALADEGMPCAQTPELNAIAERFAYTGGWMRNLASSTVSALRARQDARAGEAGSAPPLIPALRDQAALLALRARPEGFPAGMHPVVTPAMPLPPWLTSEVQALASAIDANPVAGGLIIAAIGPDELQARAAACLLANRLGGHAVARQPHTWDTRRKSYILDDDPADGDPISVLLRLPQVRVVVIDTELDAQLFQGLLPTVPMLSQVLVIHHRSRLPAAWWPRIALATRWAEPGHDDAAMRATYAERLASDWRRSLDGIVGAAAHQGALP